MTTQRDPLFQPLKLGALSLEHRVVLAPLTRNRAVEPTLCPGKIHEDYYSQRASKGGLLITEATLISPEGMAYPSVPGIFTDEQVKAWQRVTAAVHAKGGLISCQMWHTGRVAHPDWGEHPLTKVHGRPPSVSASAVGMRGRTITPQGRVKNAVPRALGTEEIRDRLCRDYATAAANCLKAGFDAVEIHAAHGYLIDQFINNGVNKRTDRYGGDIPNRCRLLFEVVEAVRSAGWSHDRIAVRLSPHAEGTMKYYQATDSDPDAVYKYAVTQLSKLNLSYLLITEPRWTGREDGSPETDSGFGMPLVNSDKLRGLYKNAMIGASGFRGQTARKAIQEGKYNAIAFGRWFISNPDLPERLRTGAPLNRYERKTFYGGGAEGYTDYPPVDGSYGAVGKYKLMDQASIGTSLAKAKAPKSKL